MSFFTWILDSIFPPRPSQLLVRNMFLHEAAKNFKPRIVVIDRVPITTLLPYRSPLVQACILEAKFHKNRKAQKLLGMLLADYIKVSFKQSAPLVIVPIPLSKKRRKERGYNQSEEIGRFCLRNLEKSGLSGLRTDLLTRTRDTTPQTTLGREARKANMQAAFAVSAPLDPRISYILLDDVVTTGATLLAAHTALRNAGTSSIYVIALAH
jgi:ComF family protein